MDRVRHQRLIALIEQFREDWANEPGTVIIAMLWTLITAPLHTLAVAGILWRWHREARRRARGYGDAISARKAERGDR